MRLRTFILSTVCSLVATTPLHAQQQPSAQPDPRFQAAAALFQSQNWPEAIDAYRALISDPAQGDLARHRLAYALHAAGRLEEAVAAHRESAASPRFRAHAQYNLACALALTGQSDAALEALQQAIDAGFNQTDQLAGDTDLDSLRGDPRLPKLLEECRAAVAPQRRFDFWVGDWDVYNPQGQRVGENRIELLESGRIVFESWTSSSGGTGKSMNFVDPQDGLWKQLWVDAGGGVVRYSGAWERGAMRFTGTYTTPQGQIEIARSSFAPLADGRVRQFIEHSRDGGATWYVYFDGYYQRKQGEMSRKPE